MDNTQRMIKIGVAAGVVALFILVLVALSGWVVRVNSEGIKHKLVNKTLEETNILREADSIVDKDDVISFIQKYKDKYVISLYKDAANIINYDIGVSGSMYDADRIRAQVDLAAPTGQEKFVVTYDTNVNGLIVSFKITADSTQVDPNALHCIIDVNNMHYDLIPDHLYPSAYPLGVVRDMVISDTFPVDVTLKVKKDNTWITTKYCTNGVVYPKEAKTLEYMVAGVISQTEFANNTSNYWKLEYELISGKVVGLVWTHE